MADVDLFEKLTLSQVARWLEMHPFDIVRVLASEGGLPQRLAFDEGDVDRIRALAGVETWWDGGGLPVADDNRRRALVRSLAQKLVARGDGRPTRADNLSRGLDGDEAALVRRAANQLIRDGLLSSAATARGMEVQVNANQRASLEAIAEGRDLPRALEALC